MSKDLFENWLTKLGEAWVKRDPSVIGTICTEDVVYYESPFGEPLKGRQAVIKEWESVPKSQKDITYSYDIIHTFDTTVIAHWQATFTRIPSGVRDTLDGIFVVRLNNKGLCEHFRMWWVVKPLS